MPVFAAAQYIVTSSSRFDITVETLSPLTKPARNKALASRLMILFSWAKV
jgi:hypothetical protein